MQSAIDRERLALKSQEILCLRLVARGNDLSAQHRAALGVLTDIMAGFAAGEEYARVGYGLPTGGGKTQSIVAFAEACNALGYRLPFAVAASNVDALCSLHSELIGAGIDEKDIGIKYVGDHGAVASTGDSSRLIQLVTHARIRLGEDSNIFTSFAGKPRAFLVWDEGLLRSDSKVFDMDDLISAVGALHFLSRSTKPNVASAYEFCRAAVEKLKAASAGAEEPEAGGVTGAAVDLEWMFPAVRGAWIEALRGAVGEFKRVQHAMASILADFLDLDHGALQVVRGRLATGGVVYCREALPAVLNRVLILDASRPIKKLASMDPSIVDRTPPYAEQIKSFEDVTIRQLLTAGGKSTMKKRAGRGISADEITENKVAKEFAHHIHEAWDRSGGILVFYPKQVSSWDPDYITDICAELIRLGRDAEQVIEVRRPTGEVDLKRKLRFINWGRHDGQNGFEYCDMAVFVTGHRAPDAAIASMIRGQTHGTTTEDPILIGRALFEEVQITELAGHFYQAISRGACRRIHNGKAGAMEVLIADASKGYRKHLGKVMPGVTWVDEAPQFLPRARNEGALEEMAEKVATFLNGLPSRRRKVSTREVNGTLSLTPSETETAGSAADRVVQLTGGRWKRIARSYVRQH